MNPNQRVVWKTTRNLGLTNIYEIQLVKNPAAQVHLITKTENSEQVIAKLTQAYTGNYDVDPITDPEIIDRSFDDMRKTKLLTPYEMIHFTWLIKDVTRAFTHQLVRYRVGTAFIQESMRFYGKHQVYKVLVTGDAGNSGNIEIYGNTVADLIDCYVELVDKGVASQDARGILPTNVLTHIYFDCSMRTLQNIYTQRMCCQAQPGEWQPILKSMKNLIELECGSLVSDMLSAPYERGEPCGYRASFDRPCVWSPRK